MPWCDDCSKFWTPSSIPPDGTCLTCGRIIAEPPDTKVPWHFWSLLVAVVAYLVYRLVQGVVELIANDHPIWAALLIVASVALVGGCLWWWRTAREARQTTADPDDRA